MDKREKHVIPAQPPRQTAHLPRWTVDMWERAWQVVVRRTTGAPAALVGSLEFQTMMATLDGAFEADDALTFATETHRLIACCRRTIHTHALQQWW